MPTLPFPTRLARPQGCTRMGLRGLQVGRKTKGAGHKYGAAMKARNGVQAHRIKARDTGRKRSAPGALDTLNRGQTRVHSARRDSGLMPILAATTSDMRGACA